MIQALFDLFMTYFRDVSERIYQAIKDQPVDRNYYAIGKPEQNTTISTTHASLELTKKTGTRRYLISASAECFFEVSNTKAKAGQPLARLPADTVLVVVVSGDDCWFNLLGGGPGVFYCCEVV